MMERPFAPLLVTFEDVLLSCFSLVVYADDADALSPGLCPDHKSMDSKNALANATKGLNRGVSPFLNV